jgi:hypothetical protein
MLAVLCYLAQLADFTVTPDQQWTGEVATDSQSLLDAISFKPAPLSVPVQACTDRRLKDIQAIDVLSPELDLVLSNILHILTKFSGLYLQYVWGHQDKKMAYHQLSLLAQLNEDEDAMASRYQQQHAQTHTTVLLTDTASIRLILPHGSITSRYTTELRHQATHGPLLLHLQKNGWPLQITRTINWKAHGTALRTRLKERTHFVKLIQGILPTANHVHRRDLIRSLCPACG